MHFSYELEPLLPTQVHPEAKAGIELGKRAVIRSLPVSKVGIVQKGLFESIPGGFRIVSEPSKRGKGDAWGDAKVQAYGSCCTEIDGSSPVPNRRGVDVGQCIRISRGELYIKALCQCIALLGKSRAVAVPFEVQYVCANIQKKAEQISVQRPQIEFFRLVTGEVEFGGKF